jgi:hypothetical protein
MFGVSLGILVGNTSISGAGFDADAQAFFDRVTAAGGTLTLTEKTATNQLVLDMKTNGIWTPMKAIYPMVGSSAAACAQNLKSSSFTGTFSSGWTFASTGVTPNGTSAYMNSGLNTRTELTVSSAYLSTYIRTNSGVGPAYDIGNSANAGGDITPTYLISRYLSSNNNAYIGIADTSYATSTPSTNSIGFWNGGTNGSSTQKLFKNGSLLKTATAISTVFTNSNLYIGANNFNGTAGLFSNKETAFASIGDGLNDTQASNFYTNVQTFNTTLSRQV